MLSVLVNIHSLSTVQNLTVRQTHVPVLLCLWGQSIRPFLLLTANQITEFL